MNSYKEDILKRICYTELVYERINKKLKLNFSKKEIEKLILDILKETDESQFQKIGKNIYAINNENKIRLTINSNNFRIITADKLTTVLHK
jgi:hypothetical protein